MNSVERERNDTFWLERSSLLVLVFFPTYVFGSIFYFILISTTFLTLANFCPSLASVGPSGIGGIWLLLLDRLTFYLGIEYAKLLVQGIELPFLWRLTIFLSVVIHSIFIVDHLLRSRQVTPPPPPPQSQSHNDHETSLSTEQEVEKVKELDGKKMMTDVEHMIHSGLETLREELGEFRDEGKKMMAQVEHMICSQFGTLRDNNIRLHIDEFLEELRDELRSKVDEVIKASTEDLNKNVKSVADQLHETYLSIQQTPKEAKTTTAKAHEAYLIFQETAKEAKTTAEKAHQAYLIFQKDQNQRQTIRGEDVEGFYELREEVQRMSVEAEIAAEELSRATVELVEAGFQQWEEDNADYLASLPFLYSNHHN